MATFVAQSAVNMSSTNGLGVLDTTAGLEQLVSASQTGGTQVWAVPPAGYLEINANVILGPDSFTADFTKLELQTGSTLNATPKWTLTGLPLDLNGTFALSGDLVNVTVNVPGMGSVTASVNYMTYEVVSLSDNLSSGNYGTFAEYVLRQADNITGSNGNDTLLGFGGNDRINGQGGNDTITGGAGNDILSGGAGSDRLNGGAGNDSLIWGGATDTYNGGTGTDRFKITSGALVDLTAVNNSKLVSLEQFDMTVGDHTLKLNYTDVLSMSASTNTIKVFGDVGDHVDVVGSFTAGSIANGFRTYNLGNGALLVVDTDVHVM